MPYAVSALRFNVHLGIQTVVATTAYPTIGPLFLVSTVWGDEKAETRIFGSTDFLGTGGRSLHSQILQCYTEAEEQHNHIICLLGAGELKLGEDATDRE